MSAVTARSLVTAAILWLGYVVSLNPVAEKPPRQERIGMGTRPLGVWGGGRGNVGREECDVRSACREAWRYSWPTELGTPVQAWSASAGPSKNRKGVKGSSVCVTRPILFRPQTGSRSRRRVTGFPSEPYPLAATNGQRKQERRRSGGGGWRRGGGEWMGVGGVGVWAKGCGRGPFRGIGTGPGVSHYTSIEWNDRA